MKKNTTYPDPLQKWSEKKQDSYGLAFAKAIGLDWFSGGLIQGGCNYSNARDRIIENRLYVRGENDPEKFKKLFQKDDGDLSMVNLDWRIINTVRKYCRVVSNGIRDDGYTINLEAVDKLSTKLKKANRQKHIDNMLSVPFLDKVQKELGLDMKPKGFVPKNMEELDIYEQLKESSLVEIAEELTINYIKEINNWSNIEKEKNKDLTDCGIAGVRVYTDPEEGIKMQFLDIENLIYSRVDMNDFSDSQYYGYVDTITVGDIQRESDFDDKKLREISKIYSKTNNLGLKYDTCSMADLLVAEIDVLRFSFKTQKVSVYKKKTRKGKTIKFTKKDEDFNPPKRKDFEKVNHVKDTWMEGSYVIGTEHIYDYKESENIVRDELNKPISPFVLRATDIYKNQLHSFLDDIKPLADELQNIHNKIQHLRSELKPDLIVIDEDVLAEIDEEGNKVGFYKETLNMLNVKGVIIQKRVDMGEMGMKDGSPVRQMATQQGGALSHLLNLYAHYYNQIRDVTGINPAADGSLPSDALLGVSKMAKLSANTVTEHIVDAALDFNKRVHEVISTRLHSIFRNPNAKHLVKMYERAVGKKNIYALEALKDRHLHDFGFTIEMTPTSEAISDFKEDLGLYLQQGLISPEIKSEATRISQKSLKLASQYLIYESKARQKQAMAQQEKTMQMKTQSDSAAAQQASQGRIQEKSMDYKMKLQYETAMSGIRLSEAQALMQIEAPKDQKEFEQDVYLEQIKGNSRINEAEFKETRKDERGKAEGSRQSKLIDQRSKDKDPIDFENKFDLF